MKIIRLYTVRLRGKSMEHKKLKEKHQEVGKNQKSEKRSKNRRKKQKG